MRGNQLPASPVDPDGLLGSGGRNRGWDEPASARAESGRVIIREETNEAEV